MNLIHTRLYKPHANDGYLVRSELLDKLIENQYKPVNLVVAPAGYGKSVAISQWLDTTKTNYSWISLDIDCNELNQFLRLFCASILPYIDKNDDLCEFLLEAPQLPDLETIANCIANSIASIQHDHVIVLDDYHLIINPDVHFLIQVLAGHISHKHSLTFISRFEPLLDWKKLKSYDLVNEIGIKDLQFSIKEISELSASIFLNPIENEISSIVFKSTEGWIVPTRLILKNIAQNKFNPATLKEKVVDKLELTNSFLEYTISLSDNEVQESIMISCLFQRFSVSLLIEIFNKLYPDRKREEDQLKIQIETFISQSLFIIPLDNDNKWYRFHDLIRDFLNHRIHSSFSQDKIKNILVIGSNYFENIQSFEEAILLGIKAEDVSLSIAIIEKNRLIFLNQQRLDVLERWLYHIPLASIENHPLLLLTRAHVSEKKGDFEKMIKDLERAEVLMPLLNDKDVNSRAQWGEYYSIKSSTDFIMGNLNVALTSSEKSMQLLNHKDTFSYYIALLYRVFALNHLGRSVEATNLLVHDKNILKSLNKNIPVENHLIQTMHFMMNGQLNSYNHEAELARTISKEESHKAIFLMSNYYLALTRYMQNRMEEALLHINEALSSKYLARPYWIMICYQLKASCLFGLKDLKKYESCIMELSEFVKNFNVTYYKNLLAIMNLEFILQQENFKISQEGFPNVDFTMNDLVHIYFKPSLTEVKLLLATDNNQNIVRAEILLKQYREKAISTHNRLLLIQVNCLNVLLLSKQNQSDLALEQLKKLLAETKEESLVRLYTDCGDDMKNLFDLLTSHDKHDAYSNRILNSFNHKPWSDRNTFEFKSNKPSTNYLNEAKTNQIKISKKEEKLLILLSQELINKEIAEVTNISTDSVKKSLYRLYKKLKVNRRSEAIQKAMDLNLIQIND